MKYEIYYNEKIQNYTLAEEVEGVKSIKKKPIKFKLKDSTARFRKEQLKKSIFSSQQ